MENRTAYALLIDSDNVSARYIGPILNELSGRYGQVTYRRIYGDWTSPQMSRWRESLAEHSITPMQQFPNSTGKNATDSFLIIDAMDILHERHVDGFCIVSSDGDFTRLASRLRDAGVDVVGMGEAKTPEAFRNACTSFVYLETLLGGDAPETAAEQADREAMRARIRGSVVDLISENGEALPLSEAGVRLRRIYPDFDVRFFGYSQLSAFLESFEGLSVVRKGGGAYVDVVRSAKRYENVANLVRERVKGAGVQGVHLGALGNEVREKYRSFDMREFGYAKFSEFVGGIDGVKVNGDRAYAG